MGKLFTPQDVSSGFNTTNSLNTNFDNIETALDRTLSRYGETPNAMAVDLDMDNNDILNAGTISCDNLLIDGLTIPDLADLTALAVAAEESATDAGAAQTAAELAQAAAEAAAASLELPIIAPGDAGKALLVNGDEDGYEYSTLSLDVDAEITARLASQAEAEAGTDNTKLMTPLRVQENFDENFSDIANKATELKAGTVQLAGYLDTIDAFTGDAGSATEVVTLTGISQAMGLLSLTNRFQFGNILVQWGRTSATGTDTTITFPTAFNAIYTVVGIPEDSTNNRVISGTNIGSVRTTTQVSFRHASGIDYINWIAIGSKL